MASTAQAPEAHGIRPYIQIARIDHWFKNVFMLVGVVLAYFLDPTQVSLSSIPNILLALAATCFVASSNYVINELLDAPYDRLHPVKRTRPAAAGLIKAPLAIVEWLLLAVLGIGLAWLVHPAVAATALALWIAGIAYNVPPVRTKELPYLDVLSESINNPLRLLLGWFAVTQHTVPPVSLFIAYWMAGAFFMAIKRLAEYRKIDDPAVAASYRRSFRHYTEDRLMVSLFFYAVTAGLFTGVFIVRYRLELILALPLVGGFFAYYMKIGLRPDSPVQNPEKLHRERGFLVYALACAAIALLLMVTHIPALYEIFNVPEAQTAPLWTLD
jgi:decaprenyl-phosphate phosphoribosyltransferase